ncbi:MAG: hypothetical protein PVF87_12610, partial [Acidimicrobiia bacterium]
MTKVIEKPRELTSEEKATVQDHELPPLRTIERPEEFQRAPMSPGPSKFIRWMGWALGVLLLVGAGGLVWWTASQSDSGTSVPGVIDPHVSPEILHGVWGAGSVGVDALSLESLHLLRSLPTQGIDPLSLQSLQLLESL